MLMKGHAKIQMQSSRMCLTILLRRRKKKSDYCFNHFKLDAAQCIDRWCIQYPYR
jgi:hypothetical protein